LEKIDRRSGKKLEDAPKVSFSFFFFGSYWIQCLIHFFLLCVFILVR
jgi:hypothetical protein